MVTTTVIYRCPFLYDTSSIPTRRRFANRSCSFSVSAHTRATIAPTVRQATRISSVTADFEHCTANQATVSSKA